MHEQLQARLQELEAEYERGQQRLKELDQEARQVNDALLRISGAIQVLREELEKDNHKESS